MKLWCSKHWVSVAILRPFATFKTPFFRIFFFSLFQGPWWYFFKAPGGAKTRPFECKNILFWVQKLTFLGAKTAGTFLAWVPKTNGPMVYSLGFLGMKRKGKQILCVCGRGICQIPCPGRVGASTKCIGCICRN